ncbi:hypothetical protein LBMAG48_00670 [Phycisphaerae bacterium]|jgi:hypothetical protein|nr:hypothetical protein LBMAG48_00670 [Phycisphaerae bacterium]
MTRFTRSLVSSFALAGAGSLAHAQLFGVGDFSPTGTQNLYSINATTGAATLIGSTGLRQISDITFDPNANALLAHTVAGDVFTLNTLTGASTLLEDGATLTPESGLAILPTTGRRFTTIFDNLHASTTGPAAWSNVGASGLSSFDVSGLAFDPSFRLFGLVSNSSLADEFVEFNLATGAATVIGATGTASVATAGLTFNHATQQLLASDGASLFSIDRATGAATLIGAHGVGGFSGIAFIPAPGSFALVIAGAVACGRRRRAL